MAATPPGDFDPIAIVVDWLDACRRRDLAALLDLHAPEASLECRCAGGSQSSGRADLVSYWGRRLEGLVPNAFGLEEIGPTPDGVQLDYVNHEGMTVRMMFTFAGDGKIIRARCAPVVAPCGREELSLQDQAG